MERTGSSSSAAGSAQGSSRRIRAPVSAAVLAAKHQRVTATLAMVTAVSSQLAGYGTASASGMKASAANGG